MQQTSNKIDARPWERQGYYLFIVMLESSFVHKSIAAPHFGADYDTVVVPMVPFISVIILLWQCIVQVSYKGSQRALSLSLSLSF